MVAEFHEALPWPAPSRPTAAISQREVELLTRLMSEEAEEFSRAAAERDLEKVADALADIVYVAYGAARHFGFDLGPILEAVHAANMSKRLEDGTFDLEEGGKVARGPNYVEPDIGAALNESKK